MKTYYQKIAFLSLGIFINQASAMEIPGFNDTNAEVKKSDSKLEYNDLPILPIDEISSQNSALQNSDSIKTLRVRSMAPLSEDEQNFPERKLRIRKK